VCRVVDRRLDHGSRPRRKPPGQPHPRRAAGCVRRRLAAPLLSMKDRRRARRERSDRNARAGHRGARRRARSGRAVGFAFGQWSGRNSWASSVLYGRRASRSNTKARPAARAGIGGALEPVLPADGHVPYQELDGYVLAGEPGVHEEPLERDPLVGEVGVCLAEGASWRHGGEQASDQRPQRSRIGRETGSRRTWRDCVAHSASTGTGGAITAFRPTTARRVELHSSLQNLHLNPHLRRWPQADGSNSIHEGEGRWTTAWRTPEHRLPSGSVRSCHTNARVAGIEPGSAVRTRARRKVERPEAYFPAINISNSATAPSSGSTQEVL
jgi:hypothetical protein